MTESKSATMLSGNTALKASFDSGDSFTQLATEEIYTRQSLVPTSEDLAQADYELYKNSSIKLSKKWKRQASNYIADTLAKGLAGAHFGKKDQIALKNKAVER